MLLLITEKTTARKKNNRQSVLKKGKAPRKREGCPSENPALDAGLSFGAALFHIYKIVLAKGIFLPNISLVPEKVREPSKALLCMCGA